MDDPIAGRNVRLDHQRVPRLPKMDQRCMYQSAHSADYTP
jgi:hypothetical protein